MNITIFHLFLILIILKLSSLYVDQKMIYLTIILVVVLLYIYSFGIVNVYLPMFNHITKNEVYEEKKDNLIKFVDETVLFDRNIKLKFDIQNKLRTYFDNLDELFYNNVKLCKHYIDILNGQRYEIINLANSYIISLPTLTDYSYTNEAIKKFQIYLYDLFFKVADKCPEYKDIKYRSANLYKNEDVHSFQQL